MINENMLSHCSTCTLLLVGKSHINR